MPILVDFSQISVGNAMKNLNKELENQDHSLLPLIRHQVFNSIKWINKRYSNKYGEIIISCDSRKYWRKKEFPFYKGHRKNNQEKSKIDFDLLFSFVNTIKEELKLNFPYRIIEVPTAESDDVIAVICKHLSTDEKYFVQEGLFSVPPPILICSSDNDFFQLSSRFQNVDQTAIKGFAPKLKDLELHLMEKCIRGESSDGIPNILSEDNSLVDKIKQKSVTVKWITPILESKVIPKELKDKYDRNRKLIDFEFIPLDVCVSIINEFESFIPKGNNGSMFKYFMEQEMMQHLDNVQDFLIRKQ